MKSVALMLPAMRMGGAEKIALNFLSELCKYYDVTIILNKREGELLSLIPENIPVIEDPIIDFKKLFLDDIRHIRLSKLFQDALYYYRIKTQWCPERNYRYIIDRTPPIRKKFDIAIAYVANVSTQIFSICDRVNAELKIAWIHGETTQLKDTQLFSSCYRTFDHIFTVSKASHCHFVNRFPECSGITSVYYNPINKEEILRKSLEYDSDCSFDEKYTNIVTVGRFSTEKGFDMIPEIVRKLTDSGFNIRWYIIGDGPLMGRIQKLGINEKVDDRIFFLGSRLNPYPFIKACDIYVQPSYEEGYSTTICEAGILGKAIVGTTTSGGIREQIEDGLNGILSDPTPGHLAQKISLLIQDKKLLDSIVQEVRHVDFVHTNEIVKLNSLILEFFEKNLDGNSEFER